MLISARPRMGLSLNVNVRDSKETRMEVELTTHAVCRRQRVFPIRARSATFLPEEA